MPPSPTIPTPALAAPPTTSKPLYASHTPQFKFQASIEDQKFMDELIALLLEGKLTHTTPAHILAASAPVRKALSDWLHPLSRICRDPPWDARNRTRFGT
jgi:hypothetical protein